MPKSAAELERDVSALTALITTLTTRLDTAEAATRVARTEAADAVREAAAARTDATDARNEAARATAALAHVNTGAAITDPAHFQRSPYNVNAPYNLNTKSGLLLYENAQEPLKVLFNGKAANIQAFLTSLSIDVEKFRCMSLLLIG